MGKALLIKNVDFSANKLDSVTFVDPVPCTGISLSTASISLTKIGNTSAISATVTPSNCTDSIQWSVSPTGVVTVQNGVVTAIGVGSATITVQCGTKSATCSVAVTHVLAQTDIWSYDGYGIAGPNLSATPPNTSVYEQAQAKHREYADLSVYTDNPTGKYRAFADKVSSLPGYSRNGIEIPYGATQMTISVPVNANQMHFAYQNNTLESGYYTDRTAYAAVTLWTPAITVTGMNEYIVDLTQLPEGTNSFVFAIRSVTAASTDIGDLSITFS